MNKKYNLSKNLRNNLYLEVEKMLNRKLENKELIFLSKQIKEIISLQLEEVNKQKTILEKKMRRIRMIKGKEFQETLKRNKIVGTSSERKMCG